MKRTGIFILLLSMILTLLSGCGKTEEANPAAAAEDNAGEANAVEAFAQAGGAEGEGAEEAMGAGKSPLAHEAYYNPQFNRLVMKTVGGEEVSTGDGIVHVVEKNGMGFKEPAFFADLISVGSLDVYDPDDNLIFFKYVPQALVQELMDLTSDHTSEEYRETLKRCYEAEVFVWAIYREVVSAPVYDWTKEMLAHFEKDQVILTTGEETYHFLYNDTFESDLLGEGDLQDLQLMADHKDDMIRDLILFPVPAPEQSFGGTMLYVNAKDMDGGTFTAADFAGYDITMVNCWTTWCQYCIQEMPDLAELKTMLPGNVNLISICFDAAEEEELARMEMADTGVNFTVLIGDEELKADVQQFLLGFPTTFFVDSSGRVVGPLSIGAPTGGSSVAESYLQLIDQALAEINLK